MKYLKTYEHNKKYKKYIVVEHNEDLFLDEIVKIEGNSLFVKDILYYNHENHTITEEDSHTDLTLDYLKKLRFTSNNYDDAKDYFIKLTELNKFNL